MPVLVGTSGWSYPSGRGTWNGIFYPPRGSKAFRAGDELVYYAAHFDTVEVNVTFYRPPVAQTTARWAKQTPPGFEFSVKLHQKFTHPMSVGRDARPAAAAPRSLPEHSQSDVDEFRSGLDPLATAGKLGALLVQFPAGFHCDEASVDYLAALLRAFGDYTLAVELRHRSWSDAHAATMRLLDEHRAAWVQIDEPKFRTSIRQDLVPNTERTYYLRLHGRNAAQWWSPDAPEERYNYLYSPEELRPFASVAKTVGPEVRKAYLYLNNHFAAKSVVNATVLKHQLGQPITGEYRPTMLEAYPELRNVVPPPIGGLI